MKKLILLVMAALFIACPPTAKNAAKIYLQQGEYEKAKEQILAGIEQSPNDYEYYALLAKADIGLGSWIDASKAFQSGMRIDSVGMINYVLGDKQNISVYWQSFYNAAIAMFNENKHGEALKNLAICKILNPEDVNQYILEGGIYGALNDIEKANASYSAALSMDPENPEAYFLIGKALFEKKLYDSSAVYFSNAINYFQQKYDRVTKILFQNLPEVDKELAKKTIKLWKEQKAEELDELVKVNLGFDGGLAAQRRNIEQFYKTNDGFSRSYYYLGLTYYNQKNDELALENLMKSLDLAPDDLDALYFSGEIMLKTRKYQDAINYFEKITQLKEDDLYAWFYMGVANTQLKNYKRAIEIYESKVLLLDPENIDAMTNLAYVYREMGNNKKALEWLTKAEKIQKEKK